MSSIATGRVTGAAGIFGATAAAAGDPLASMGVADIAIATATVAILRAVVENTRQLPSWLTVTVSVPLLSVR